MQYLVSVIDDTAGLATPDEMAAINAFNDRLKTEGHWVFAGGLAAPSSATVIDNRGEEAMFTDGPFLESKEYLAGFWIMEAADLDVALATAGSKACNRKVEMRRNAATAAGRAYGRRRCPAMASTSRIVLNRRTRKS
jgi:hypothetical protein